MPPSARRDSVLVVEPDELRRHRLKAHLRTNERDVFIAASMSDALGSLPHVDPVLVVVALDLPDARGVRAIDVVRERAPGVPILVVADAPGVGAVVEAVRHGAVDVVTHEDSRERLLEAVSRALQEARSTRQVEHAREQAKDRYGLTQLLTQSPRMLDVFDQIRAVAQTDATVLILGETGTGKELVTRAIHERSRRKEKPFIAVNCGAFTESLLESELFGHERGSFTGAVGRREGLFEMADGGTLFLDELGETSLNVQVNLLRVLEEMTFRRVGGRDSVRVDVRILAATNVQLQDAVKAGNFRQDLYYRLNVFPIRLPPLRERKEDIPLLMRHFLDEIAEEYTLESPIITKEALDAIIRYGWPGNVRQLRAMCERWTIQRFGQRLLVEHLPSDMTGLPSASEQPAGILIDENRPMKDTVDRMTVEVERAYLFRVLRRCAGHLERTAAEAGISRRTLYTKMKDYGLEAGDFKS